MVGSGWFVGVTAVFVALANLVVLVHFFGGNPTLPTGVSWEAVSLRGAVLPVLCAVLAGLVASEIILRRFDRLSAFGRFVFFERLSHLHAGIVAAVCLGGALTGILLAAVLVLRTSPNIAFSLPIMGFHGATYGAALGAMEGLLLAPPLAAILGRLGGDHPGLRAAA